MNTVKGGMHKTEIGHHWGDGVAHWTTICLPQSHSSRRECLGSFLDEQTVWFGDGKKQCNLKNGRMRGPQERENPGKGEWGQNRKSFVHLCEQRVLT